MGIHLPSTDAIKKVVKEAKPNVRCEPVPLNKVGDYSEGNDNNTTLSVEYNDVQSLAILDNGVGVALITIQVWEAWGKPALRKTWMKLQLVDGFMERPLGLLEKIVVTSCGIEYKHTFVVVAFNKEPNYEIISGRPFMHQMKMI